VQELRFAFGLTIEVTACMETFVSIVGSRGFGVPFILSAGRGSVPGGFEADLEVGSA
jgi:hypothetical protein